MVVAFVLATFPVVRLAALHSKRTAARGPTPTPKRLNLQSDAINVIRLYIILHVRARSRTSSYEYLRV